jgi:hypothetical protein
LTLALAGILAAALLGLGAGPARAQGYDPDFVLADEDDFSRDCTLQQRIATALMDPGFVQELLQPGFLARELLSPAFIGELVQLRTVRQRERALDRAYRELDRGNRGRAQRHFQRADRLDTLRGLARMAYLFGGQGSGSVLSRFGCD